MQTRLATPDAARLVAHLRRSVQELHPAYFAMVMATGIVSIVAGRLGLQEASVLLFRLNVPAYLAVWALFAARAIAYPRRFLADLGSHQRGPGFFTSVAATCVLGLQFATLGGNTTVALGLFWLGLVLWGACTYSVFVLLSIREGKPSLAEGINGGWLVAVVATQSLCLLGAAVLAPRSGGSDAVFFFLAALWLAGGMLYVWMISLIFYRYMFFRFSPADLMPPYWINMGAVAISVVAGAALSDAARGSALLQGLLPFLNGLTLMFWATATWWIPMLLLLGLWRHGGASRIPFVYDPLYWGLVFPLGMYSLATYRVGQVFALPFLWWLARAFAVVALCAWLLTFLGMASRLIHLLVLAARSLQPERGAVAPQPAAPDGMTRRS